MEEAPAWYHSDAYDKAIPLRRKAAVFDAVIVHDDAAAPVTCDPSSSEFCRKQASVTLARTSASF